MRHRLPPAPQIQNFLKRSLAIFMLLRLRIYLKQAYNLSDKRIDSYANNDTVSDSTKSKVKKLTEFKRTVALSFYFYF